MKLILITDGSANTKLRVGSGAYWAFSEGQQSLASYIKLKRFDTSSSKQERQTLLWAFSVMVSLKSMLYGGVWIAF